jgi:hypothetical protein
MPFARPRQPDRDQWLALAAYNLGSVALDTMPNVSSDGDRCSVWLIRRDLVAPFEAAAGDRFVAQGVRQYLACVSGQGCMPSTRR